MNLTLLVASVIYQPPTPLPVSGTVQVYDFDEYIHRERAPPDTRTDPDGEGDRDRDGAAPLRQLRPVRTLRARREGDSCMEARPDLTSYSTLLIHSYVYGVVSSVQCGLEQFEP